MATTRHCMMNDGEHELDGLRQRPDVSTLNKSHCRRQGKRCRFGAALIGSDALGGATPLGTRAARPRHGRPTSGEGRVFSTAGLGVTEDRDDAEAKAEAEKPRPPKSLCHHLSRHGPAARRRRGGVERQAPGGHKARQSPKCSELMWLGSPELTSAGSTVVVLSARVHHRCGFVGRHRA
jgi:hypothetical protein